MVEHYLKNIVKPGSTTGLNMSEYPVETIEEATQAFEMFKKWYANLKSVNPIATELSLVSEKYQVGGTMDMVFEIGKELSILDLKTGKIYPEHIIQVVGYGKIWNENFPDNPIESYHLIRTGRDKAIFEHRYYQDIEWAFESFKKLRELYEDHKTLKKMV
jgi:hypothetical protein